MNVASRKRLKINRISNNETISNWLNLCVCGGFFPNTGFNNQEKVKLHMGKLPFVVNFLIMKCFLCRPLESSSDCDPSLGPIDPQDYRATKLVEQVREILLTFSFEKLVNQMLISPYSTGQASHERTDSQAT